MKFAICNETFQDWPFAKAFAFARECGYTGIEIAPFTMALDAREISAAQRAEVRRQAEAADLTVIGLHWLLAKTKGYYLTTPDADVRRSTGAYIEEPLGFEIEEQHHRGWPLSGMRNRLVHATAPSFLGNRFIGTVRRGVPVGAGAPHPCPDEALGTCPGGSLR